MTRNSKIKPGPNAILAGHKLHYFETIGSTNAYALELAGGADTGTNWIIAGQQSAGRGRLGRVWSSPPGNLYATLLLIDPCPMREAAKLGFVAGVALARTVQQVAPQLPGLSLKWPNDLLLRGAKLAGILIEGAVQRDGRFAVALGMGVNLAFHPQDTPYQTTSLAKSGYPVSVNEFFSLLSDMIVTTLADFDRGAGFATIRDNWLAMAHGMGGPITIQQSGRVLSGVFEGLDADGRLKLGYDGKLQLIDAGDVYFPSPSALGAG